MSKMITKVEADGTLLWCGYKGFDPIQTQRTLQASGMTLRELRDDKWAVIESSFAQPAQENNNG